MYSLWYDTNISYFYLIYKANLFPLKSKDENYQNWVQELKCYTNCE